MLDQFTSRTSGFCAAEFFQNPDPRAVAGTHWDWNNRLRQGKRVWYRQCLGQRAVTHRSFASQSPWMLPFNIRPLNFQEALTLPEKITVLGKNFSLAGFTLHERNHFTAVIQMQSGKFFYDGIAANLVPIAGVQNRLSTKSPTTALYLLD